MGALDLVFNGTGRRGIHTSPVERLEGLALDSADRVLRPAVLRRPVDGDVRALRLAASVPL